MRFNDAMHLFSIRFARAVFAGVAALSFVGVVASSSLTTLVGATIASPTIGYVYGAGLTPTAAGGIIVYQQHANGSLTDIQEVGDGDAVHASVLVHLKSGMVLYDLTRTSLHAFHIAPVTGRLTSFSVPAPTGPVSSIYGLAAYDPLGHGQPGSPMLLTGTCNTSTYPCVFSLEEFKVNPTTGALDPGTVGASNGLTLTTAIVGDGLGHFSFVETPGDGSYQVASLKAMVTGGVTGIVGVSARTISDNAVGQPPHNKYVGNTLLITKSLLTEFPVNPIYALSDHPPGWAAYSFGSNVSQGEEQSVGGEVTSSVNGVSQVLVGESGGTIASGKCAIKPFGTLQLGLGGGLTVFPCGGQFVNSMFEQGGFLYVGRYGSTSVSFHDAGNKGISATAQGTVTSGVQMYSWTGFYFAPPVVSVPLKVSLKTGIPVTITCTQTCAGTLSVKIRVAGNSTVHALPLVIVKSHPASTFVIKMTVSAVLVGTLHSALVAHKVVTVTTTATLSSGINTVTPKLLSTMTL